MKSMTLKLVLVSLMISLEIIFAPLCLGGDFVDFDNIQSEFRDGHLNVAFDYKQKKEGKIEKVQIFARQGEKELYLASSALLGIPEKMMKEKSGHISLELPVPYLPTGKYDLIMKCVIISDIKKSVLKSVTGRSLIQVAGYKGRNYELRCRIVGKDIAPFIRGQEGIAQSSDTWNFYYVVGLGEENFGLWSFKNNKWLELCPAKCDRKEGWCDLVVRCKGETFEVEVDGKKLIECKDEKRLFSDGYVGFRSYDNQTAYIDNASVKDLDTGKIIIQDDFDRDAIGDAWKICGGSWEICKGIPIGEKTQLGTFDVPDAGKVELPKVELKRRGDGIDMFIEGKPTVPLIFSMAASGGLPYSDVPYDVLRDTYNSGIRLFAPIVTITNFDKATGHMDLRKLDDMMAQFLAACPEGYFILRMGIPAPQDLPASEKFHLVRNQGGEAAQAGNEDTKIESNFDASLASEKYKKFFAEEMRYVIDHFKGNGYGRHILGVLVTGGGYELNWGQPGPWLEYKIDASPVQIKRFGEYLKQKYGNVEALRKAWGDDTADFINPKLPGIEDRTVSDIAGFRDPSAPKSRWVLDFLDLYSSEGQEMLTPIFNSINEAAPYSFFGVFDLFSLNVEWACIAPGCSADKFDRVLNNPGVKFIAGIYSYYDRMAGGVSASTSMPWESARMHGKMMLDEIDMRTPVISDMIAEKSYEDAAASMRREFANTCLIERNAMWFFDMGCSGPWFNHPSLLREMSREMEVGKVALELERKNISEILVVIDIPSWKYCGTTVKKLEKGENVPFQSIEYTMNNYTLPFVSMMRMGAPKDFIVKEDLDAKKGYKLYVFPTSFQCDEKMRKRIRALAEEGAVCLLMGPAGLINEKNADLANMEQLLGMKVNFDEPKALIANVVPSNQVLTDGFTGKETMGAGSYVNIFNTGYTPYWHRFYLDNPDKETLVLANYADGKPAMGMKRIGKGAIVYSTLPITHPTMYRNIAKFAGVHVYLDTDDASYADNNFVMIHTKDAGSKTVKLKTKAPEVVEVFTGEILGRDTDTIEVKLPAKHTAVYYVGNNAEFAKKIKGIAQKNKP